MVYCTESNVYIHTHRESVDQQFNYQHANKILNHRPNTNVPALSAYTIVVQTLTLNTVETQKRGGGVGRGRIRWKPFMAVNHYVGVLRSEICFGTTGTFQLSMVAD